MGSYIPGVFYWSDDTVVASMTLDSEGATLVAKVHARSAAP